MNFAILIIIFSFIAEAVLSNIFINTLFTVCTLIIIEPYVSKEKNYYLIAFFTGLLYDVAYTNTFLFNAILFLIIALIIKRIHLNYSINLISINLITGVITIFYNIISFLILVIINYFAFNFSYLFSMIINSLFINIVYILLLYIITNYLSKKYRINKVD